MYRAVGKKLLNIERPTLWILGELAEFLDGELSQSANPEEKINHFFPGLWGLQKGDVFLPIYTAPARKGRTALEQGASAVITDDDSLAPDCITIRVDNIFEAAKILASHARDKFSGKIIGITGSAGKSTTKLLLVSLLNKNAKINFTTDNQNLVGFNLASMASLPENLDYAIFEMALLEPTTVKTMSENCRPNVGVITSIGMNHAEEHENPEEGIPIAKSELFFGLEFGGTAILPSSDKYYDKLLERAKQSNKVAKIISCGRQEKDDVKLVNVKLHPTHSDVEICVENELYTYSLPQPGRHVVDNSLLVVGTLIALGEPLTLLDEFSKFVSPPGRTVRMRADFPEKIIEIIDDAVNASPHQVEALLEIISLRNSVKRRVFVFGDMASLGPNSSEMHARLGPAIENAGVDLLITVGPISRVLTKNVSISSINYHSARAAKKDIQRHFKHGDLVAFKGSNSTKLKMILGEIERAAHLRRADLDWMIEEMPEL